MDEQHRADEGDEVILPDPPRPATRGAGRAAEHPATLQTLLLATRALLRARGPEDAVAVVADVVEALGGALEPPDPRASHQLPIDLTFGVAEPLVPAGSPTTLALLRTVLPAVVEDAHVALGRIRREDHLTSSAWTDALTGVVNRRVAMRVLSRLEPGDIVAMIDLDHFKVVNDEHGHDTGDDVLRAFGRALRGSVRGADTAGRLGGEEFVLLLPRTDQAGALRVLERIRTAWEQTRPMPITFSAGLATVDERGGRAALSEADRAMYAAKGAGRDRVEVAG